LLLPQSSSRTQRIRKGISVRAFRLSAHPADTFGAHGAHFILHRSGRFVNTSPENFRLPRQEAKKEDGTKPTPDKEVFM